jgi:thiol-disulfide isomerase/thioredoxin
MSKQILNFNYIAIGLITICLIGLSLYLYKTNKVSSLSDCLSGKAVFYGASWCPNCTMQKKLFGDYANNINYIECSTNENEAQSDFCEKEKIAKYPTWKFSDGSVVEGLLKLETLAAKSGCSY